MHFIFLVALILTRRQIVGFIKNLTTHASSNSITKAPHRPNREKKMLAISSYTLCKSFTLDGNPCTCLSHKKAESEYCIYHASEATRKTCENVHTIKLRMEKLLRVGCGIEHNELFHHLLKGIDNRPLMLVKTKKQGWRLRRILWFLPAMKLVGKYSGEDIIDVLVYAPKKVCRTMKISSYAFIFLEADEYNDECHFRRIGTIVKKNHLTAWDPFTVAKTNDLSISSVSNAQYMAFSKKK